MKLALMITGLASLLALAACETPTKKQEPESVKPPPVVNEPAPPPKVEPVRQEPVKVEPPKPEPPTKSELDEEAARLKPHLQGLQQVFGLSERVAGLRAKPGAPGVYELKSFTNGRFRLVLAQLPNNPAKLKLGAYTVNIELGFDYEETQTCAVDACAGKKRSFVRSETRQVQMQVSRANNFSASRDIALFEGKDARSDAKPPKGYKASYANLVVTVKKMALAGQ